MSLIHRSWIVGSLATLASVLPTCPAIAQGDSTSAPQSAPPALTLGAYAEVAYAWNFERPGNDITALRGFDHRHGMFDLQNAVLDAQWQRDGVSGRVTYQLGTTPATYYLGETTVVGGGGTSGSDPILRRGLQQAFLGVPLDRETETVLQGGLFLSPIGPEGIAVKDNWNWSRSNLFYGLPFYHTGVKVVRPLGAGWTVNGGLYNGWNSAVDGNDDVSVGLQAVRAGAKTTASLLYFGGNERADGAPEGSPWRHLVDLHLTWLATSRLTLLGHVDLGSESNEFGTSSWIATALYGRLRLAPEWCAAVRGDYFEETVADDDGGSASAIFWPVERVSSVTATLEWRPRDAASVRLELRHDTASDPAFFGHDVEGDGVETPFVPTEDHQTTVTFGVTAWM